MDRLLDATARAEREHFWFRGFRRFVAPLLAQAAGRRTDLRILDCGCGTGNNLRMLRTYGRATGIDLTFSGLAYARRQGERLVARASALTLPFSADTFDLVTSFDVIYAFDDDQAAQALRKCTGCCGRAGTWCSNVAALPILRGNHSILGGEVQRYTRPACAGTSRAPDSTSSASLTRTPPSCRSWPVCGSRSGSGRASTRSRTWR